MRGLIILCLFTLATTAPEALPNKQHKARSVALGGHLKEVSNGIQEQQEAQYQQSLSLDLPATHNQSPARFSSPDPYIPVGEDQSSLSFNYGNFASAQQAIQNAIITKQFYIHSAQDEEADEVHEKVVTVGQPRKNYNVVFIRAPVKHQSRASVRIIPAIQEDKTVIYVLNKKSEAAEIEAHVEDQPTATTKPEVYFIKYRTPEEAQHAQQKIQAEYAHLGGSTLVSNEGVSPITSVIGSLDGNGAENGNFEHQSEEQLVATSGNNGYLPPNKRY